MQKIALEGTKPRFEKNEKYLPLIASWIRKYEKECIGGDEYDN